MRKRLVLLICLLLVGCAPAQWDAIPALQIAHALAATPTATPSATATLTPTPSPTYTPTFTPPPTFTPTATPISQVIKHVLIVSFDGLRGDAVEAAPMENLMALMDTGAYTLHAQSINYPTTLPAHASMLSGMCIEKTGVDWNAMLYYRGYSKGVDLFDLAHEAGLMTAMIVGKDKLRQLAEPETTNLFEVRYGSNTIATAAVNFMPMDFEVMFVHFSSPDLRGHKYGWMSAAQLQAIREADAGLGKILTGLDETAFRSSTLIIVTADHGGHDKDHDGSLQVDYDVPWVLSGPGVLPMELTAPVSITDTAATAAYALGLTIPAEWDGSPVYEAFGLPLQERSPDVCK